MEQIWTFAPAAAAAVGAHSSKRSAALALAVPTAHADRHTLTISGTPPASVTAGQSYSFTPTAIDSHTRTLVFAIANQPAWASFSSSTGQLSGTPGSASVGTYANIVIAVSDGMTNGDPAGLHRAGAGSGQPASAAPPPAPPVISGTPPTSVMAGSGYAFQPTASDPAGNPLSFSVQNKPAWANFSSASGRLDGTPSSAQTGTYANIVISASDGQAASALPAFNIAVTSPPPPPAAGHLRHATDQRDGRQRLRLPAHGERSGRQAAVVLGAEQARVGQFQYRERAAGRHPEQRADRHLRQHRDQRERRTRPRARCPPSASR